MVKRKKFNMNRLSLLEKKIQKKINEKSLIKNQSKKLKLELKKTKIMLFRKERALELVKQVALKTQKMIEFHLSDMVSMGMNSVFSDDYGFKVIFGIKRGKTECELFFEKNGHLVDPIDFSGLGETDIAAFCLRCACWSMTKETRNVLILDEPFKHLSVHHHAKAGELVKMISKELNLQIIMVTHSKEFTEHADKLYEIKRKGEFSKVKELT